MRTTLRAGIITALFASICTVPVPASAQEQARTAGTIPDTATLTVEVDGCRMWRVIDQPAARNASARLEAKYVYFTKCGNLSLPSTAQTQDPFKGEAPKNASLLAEVDGCRVWRIGDQPEGGTSYATLEPRSIYFARCGNMAVPVTPSQ